MSSREEEAHRYRYTKLAERERQRVDRLQRRKHEEARSLRGAMKMATTTEEKQAIAKIYGIRLRTTAKNLGMAERKLRRYSDEKARLVA